MGGGRPGAGGSGDQQKEMQEKQAAMEDMRNSILSQVLTQEARARRNKSPNINFYSSLFQFTWNLRYLQSNFHKS